METVNSWVRMSASILPIFCITGRRRGELQGSCPTASGHVLVKENSGEPFAHLPTCRPCVKLQI